VKVAIVHDYIKEYGGAERVLEALHEIWPDAPVYTTVFLPNFLGPHRDRFKDWKIKTSFLQYLPFKSKLISPIRIIAPLIFKSFSFSSFDVVIVSATGAYSPNTIKIRNPKSEIRNNTQDTKYKIQNTVHIYYCHTPPRYLYGYATAREWKSNLIFRVLGELANHFLRLVDYKSSQNVDHFIANSENVRGRIKKFYRKDSIVVYPPVDSEAAFKIGRDPKNYYLAGGRLARPKHVDLIVETFSKLNLPLKIFGRGFAGYELELKSKAKSKIEFLGEVTDEGKRELMRNAKAFIFASEDEDFGITPVEAMSVGTPVIAYKSGGVVESVLDPSTGHSTVSSDRIGSGRQKPTGIFFDELTIESLSKAIREFNSLKINPEDCIAQAQKFSKERFKKEIKEFVNNKLRKFNV